MRLKPLHSFAPVFFRLIGIIAFAACALAGLNAAQPGDRQVSILVPGFSARELPLDLSNINNLRFREDGRLTALGYDGRIHLLKDTDGDGLEDRAELFWGEPSLIVPVGMCWTKDGLYVSSHGKVSFFPDRDHDDRADSEEVITTNWPPVQTYSGNVDATAVTLDREGNLYFGLLTANYSNAYLVENDVPHYDLKSRRGTIQKFSIAKKTLETVATGIRVPYALAFNKHGDLFVTDQEGETWCPNGNPLDELNHVIPGRNYGFPPRHPRYLPDLISEPPVVSFGPQHQSTCGLVFNEPSARQRLFGPASWEEDAFIAGESRGKIFRVSLVKTPFGYIGKEHIFARLRMLATDVAISPAGDLYVSCHGGQPDWGTGPAGKGKLFKISYERSSAPLPVAMWAAHPLEARIAFDKPLHPSITNRMGGAQIEFGEYVRAADRLENVKPPYKTVSEQERTARGKLKVVAAALSEDQRTLILTTDPHSQTVTYALGLAGVRGREASGEGEAVDIDYNLNGFSSEWRDSNGATGWSGWLPHLDLDVIRALTIGSAEHERFFALVSRPGTLTFRGQIVPPFVGLTIRLEANVPFELEAGGGPIRSAREADREVAAIVIPPGDQPLALELRLRTGRPAVPALRAVYFSDDDPTRRPVPLHGFRVPWAPPHRPPPSPPEISTELAGGDFERGRSLFFGEQLQCARCHRIRGEGAALGPDLSNLAHRDAASVLRDIREPDAMIHPDFVSYHVSLNDGDDLTGLVRAQSAGALRVSDASARERVVRRAEIKRMQPSGVSLMPAGLLEGRKESEIRDLLTFLLHEPPVRAKTDVQPFLAQPPRAGETARRIRIVLVANKQDHGPGQHDYPWWQTNLNEWLSTVPGVTVENAWEWPSPTQFENANAILFYYWNRSWTPEKFAEMDRYLARGGGMALFHSATISDNAPEELAGRIGLAAHPVRVKYLHAPIDLKFTAPTNHPITAGFSKLHLLDEPYWPMIGDTNRIQVLATAEQDGADHPMLWTLEKGRSRVFVSIPGHYTWTHQDPLFRVLALRAIAWSAREDPNRFLAALEKRLAAEAAPPAR